MVDATRASLRQTSIAVAATMALGGCGAGGGSAARGADTPAPATVTAFSYAPFAASYRLTTHNRTEQEFGGQVNAMEYAMTTYLAAEAAPAESGGLAISLHVDSLVAIGPLPPGVSQGDLDGVRGSIFRGSMAPTGAITDFEPGSGSGPLLAQMNQSMQRFLSVVPTGGAHPGQSWVDSTTAQAGSQGTDIEIATVTTYTAGDWIQRGSVRALAVSARADYTLSGTGAQGGAEFVLDGTGVSWIEILLAEDGRLFERTSADSMNMTASILSMGTIVPVTQVRTDSLVVVP